MRFVSVALAALSLSVVALPAAAEPRFFAYDPADALTQSLTRGVTFQVDRRLMGGLRVERLFSTTSRGSAALETGGPDAAVAALPADARETNPYRIVREGDGRALANALCPGSEETWLVAGRIRLLRPLTMHAVGRWPDGAYRHCARLDYVFRGEWAQPPRDDAAETPAAR